MINTREIAAEYRLAHWSRIMQERMESGLSIKEFCKQIGICGNTYFYWQRRLRETACENPAIEKEAKQEISVIPNGWAVCESAKPEIADASVITIEIGKFRIKACADTDSEHLSKVCRTLLSLC